MDGRDLFVGDVRLAASDLRRFAAARRAAEGDTVAASAGMLERVCPALRLPVHGQAFGALARRLDAMRDPDEAAVLAALGAELAARVLGQIEAAPDDGVDADDPIDEAKAGGEALRALQLAVGLAASDSSEPVRACAGLRDAHDGALGRAEMAGGEAVAAGQEAAGCPGASGGERAIGPAGTAGPGVALAGGQVDRAGSEQGEEGEEGTVRDARDDCDARDDRDDRVGRLLPGPPGPERPASERPAPLRQAVRPAAVQAVAATADTAVHPPAAPPPAFVPPAPPRRSPGEPQPLAASEVSDGLRRLDALRAVVARSGVAGTSAGALGEAFESMQRWMAGLGRSPLETALPSVTGSGLGTVRADEHGVALVRRVLLACGPVESIDAQAHAETLFVRFAGARLDPRRADGLQGALSAGAARLDADEHGLRLVLPASLRRMRIVTIGRGERRHALAWSQYVGVDDVGDIGDVGGGGEGWNDALGPLPGPRHRIRLRAGLRDVSIGADAIGPLQQAVCWPRPPLLDGPAWLAGACVSPDGEVLPWVLP